MNDIEELHRYSSPAERPQSLAWDGETLWMGSIATRRLYAIDPQAWKVVWETAAPGSPWGLAVVSDSSRGNPGRSELRVVSGEPPDDNRFIRRCIPHHGFDTVFKIPCPDDTGSQLGYDGNRLHLSQWYNQRILALRDEGQVELEVKCPRQICGQVIVDGMYYLVTTDDETTNDYYLTRLDARSGKAESTDLARIPFAARALAFDGQRFWTNHREKHEIVCFQRLD